MVSLTTPVCDFGWKAPDFSLPGVDGKTHTLESVSGPNGLLVMFICNHCPYVKAVLDRIVRDVRELQMLGVGAVAIMSNDPAEYVEDSFENMARVAKQNNFSFPYVIDESQAVAHAYGAVCTPDFFGFNANMALQYRGRLDASRKDAAPAGVRRDLLRRCRRLQKPGRGLRTRYPAWAAR